MKQKYWSNHKWVTCRSKLPTFIKWSFSEIHKVLPANKKLSILDLGVGDGKLILSLPRTHQFIGLDSCKEQLDLADLQAKKQGTKIKLILSDFTSIPLADNTIDVVVSNASLHHGKHKAIIFSEVYRVLKTPGIFIFADFYNEFGRKYSTLINNNIKKNKLFAKAFTKSLCDTYNDIPMEVRKNHPEEYHVDPYKLLTLLSSAGFKNKILPGYDPAYSIICARKLEAQ
jgi:ubiquinone/menaquinone biosynthesis C-methylase UbiE